LPGFQLHLVIITREDPSLPLARLRANNKLTEIRAKDLRFSGNDVKAFFNEMMGLALAEKDIAVLEEKTEGWIAGLQLAGLSIRETSDPAAFIAALSGNHRFILSYLTEQVLNQQPEEVRRFMLQTSILEKLNGDLCNEITGRSDGAAMLEQLYNSNLFLIPLDDQHRWYRYHHLFSDLLRDRQDRLHTESAAALHLRASQWYSNANMPAEAIHHALGGQDYARTVELLENHAMDMIMRGYAKTVNTWVQAIPEVWRSRSHKTKLAFAWANILRGNYAESSRYLDQLEEAIKPHSKEGDPIIQAEWLVLKALFLYMQGEFSRCMDLASEALVISPEEDAYVRSLARYVQGSTYQLGMNIPQASAAYEDSIRYGRRAGNLFAEIMSTISLIGLDIEHGKLHKAHEIAKRAIDHLEGSNELPPMLAFVYLSLGDVYLQWNKLEEVEQVVQRARHLSALGGYNTGNIFCRILSSRLYRANHDLDAAEREIQEAADLVPETVPEYIRQEVDAHRVRIHLAGNRLGLAEEILREHGFDFRVRFSYPELPAHQTDPLSIGLLYNSALHFLLAQEQNKDYLEAGLKLADQLIADSMNNQQILVSLESLLIRAQLNARLGAPSASTSDLGQALKLAEPERIIGVFLEQGLWVQEEISGFVKRKHTEKINPSYIGEILAAFSKNDASPGLSHHSEVDGLIEPLTDREVEVLRLMVDGLTYNEIGERLFISLNTIRSHVKAVYGKLVVNNRIQAIEKARRLNIL
jgi:LuxR family maltose regulon positive regulatory protein